MSLPDKRMEPCSLCGMEWNISRKMDPDDYGGAYVCPRCRQRLSDKGMRLKDMAKGDIHGRNVELSGNSR